MSSPELTRRLVLEALERTPDGAGGYVDAWAALGSVWAQVTAGSGRESAADALPVSSVPYRVIVRSAPAGSPRRPRPDQRFREGSRCFHILAVADADAHGRYLTCFAREEEVST
ncbi:head-tail adaptor protein [Tropicimonas sp.]|uniref:head-tail adaptor protein n=1 Tax=Tropicimonas sp. TaxID=2067044 RepID=UPI003A867154